MLGEWRCMDNANRRRSPGRFGLLYQPNTEITLDRTAFHQVRKAAVKVLKGRSRTYVERVPERRKNYQYGICKVS